MTMFFRILLLLLLSVTIPVASAADAAPSETDLAGITYFAPICPFFYRMMTPEGELIEFQQRPDGKFIAPPGWSAGEAEGRIVVSAPGRKWYSFKNGRLVNYRHGKRKVEMSYPFEPAYGGEPMSLWGTEGFQAFNDAQERASPAVVHESERCGRAFCRAGRRIRRPFPVCEPYVVDCRPRAGACFAFRSGADRLARRNPRVPGGAFGDAGDQGVAP